MFPLSLHSEGFESGKDAVFCQMLFLHQLRGSFDFWHFSFWIKSKTLIDLQLLNHACNPSDESHLVMMDNPFNVLLDSISQDLVENFGCPYSLGKSVCNPPF